MISERTVCCKKVTIDRPCKIVLLKPHERAKFSSYNGMAYFVVLKNTRFDLQPLCRRGWYTLLTSTSFLRPRAVKLSDGLSALRNSVLRQFPWEHQSDRRLHRPRVHGVLAIHLTQLPSLCCQTLESILHERVHDGHRLFRHSHLRVHLLQHLVDVNVVRLFGFPLRGLAGAAAPTLG